MIVDINRYDLLLGLDFLIKIGVVVDFEKNLIQIKQGLGNNVQILPLNMIINMLQLVIDQGGCDSEEIKASLFSYGA
jgi:hypothetical protein